RGLASHYPMLALLAGFLLALDGVAAAATRRRRWLWLLGAAACGSGMALARHVGLLLTLAGAVLVVANRRTSRRERLALTVVLGAIPIAVWIGVRHALGQSGSHALFGSDRALFPTAWQMLHHIGRDLGPFPVGLLLLIAIVARLLALRRQRDALAFTATALFGVLAVFLLVPIADEPSSRFVGFAALIVGALGVGEAMRTSHRRLGLAALALLVLPPTVHAGKHVLFGRRGRESVTADGGERFLPPEAALVRRGREPPGRDRTTIVEPPLFRWDAERLRRGEGRR
ncbi:MAG: hypothetical protein KDE27_28080, partial [Planctomycetes bacterium]|nr:hypothetical protein [Planctomycetota bacterium]